jgi:hypothetical protein
VGVLPTAPHIEERPHSSLGYLTPAEFAQKAKGEGRWKDVGCAHLENVADVSHFPTPGDGKMNDSKLYYSVCGKMGEGQTPEGGLPQRQSVHPSDPPRSDTGIRLLLFKARQVFEQATNCRNLFH